MSKTVCMNMYWISPSVGKHCQKFAGHDGKCGKKGAARHCVECERLAIINDNLRVDNANLSESLHRIATMQTEPRPDGTFNYSREAIISIARKALDE